MAELAVALKSEQYGRYISPLDTVKEFFDALGEHLEACDGKEE